MVNFESSTSEKYSTDLNKQENKRQIIMYSNFQNLYLKIILCLQNGKPNGTNRKKQKKKHRGIKKIVRLLVKSFSDHCLTTSTMDTEYRRVKKYHISALSICVALDQVELINDSIYAANGKCWQLITEKSFGSTDIRVTTHTCLPTKP